MADRNSTPPRGAPPFLLSKAGPTVLREDLVRIVGAANFRRAVCAWSAADAERAEVMELQLKEKHDELDARLRRCDDCALNLGRDVLRALGNCARWGKPRHGVETCCPAFVAKGGAQ